MPDIFINIDTRIFLLLNGLHNSFFDFLMYWISNRFIWIPMYAFFLYLIIKRYKIRAIWIVLLIALLITTSDQLSVFIKNYVQRPRPCHNPELLTVIHLVKDHCGGAFGFVSSHATNTFALAIFLIPFLKKTFKWIWLFLIAWAVVVSYSRIYLGVHYPGDVLFGGMLGILIGYIISSIYFLFFPNKKSKA